MVSMVIVLVLVAVSVSLLFGRLAEMLGSHFRAQTEPRLPEGRGATPNPEAPVNKAA